ncbi:Splicing factor U2af large subunit A [Auxenochlorella protothecoides]|uniref:Splicing factor U2af large subunit A n=2 Tax=Auxenochlorella protothecoides TaxID=3075 RepID=A0A087SRG0_AUXPR|nr:Splicing factor U2af large subunit A [Auxenochlorella protothecoides]KFM28314.1 Splicing factor U2af large subunit A [Auxenochlorella protothecoides]
MPAGSVFGGAASQQATRHARRIYVGGLPPSATEDGVASFFSNALAAVGGTVAGPGSCVVNVYINFEKKFAFVELRTVEETSNAMALDGIMYEGVTENRGSDRIFVGGLPYYLTEEHIRELLSSFGVIRQLDIVRDRETQQFKGYCFVVFEEQPMAEMAMAGLHGMKMGDRALTVKPANDNSRNNDGGGGAVTMVAPPRVVRLLEAVTPDELANDEEYADIMEDMREECGKYGTVLQVHIPRPGPPDAPAVPGLGKVLIEFAEPSAAIAARNAMHGRRFSGRTVVATLLTDDDYKLMKWD